ncbi:MAG: topoisomerase [Caulobacteraceae bacterium]|nr:topoisomerase [Caulobacteraceae bacterium]
MDGPVLAQAAGLSYANDHDPGITRVKTRSGFAYRHPSGAPVRDAHTLDRIRALAVPPAYTDVWICPDPDGHIQATGRDQRRRKQYRYHPQWRAHRDENKYGRMAAFARALPRLRARVDEDLARRGLPREKVLAAVVRLLELTLIRVGNDEYARRNRSFGLTTLRKRHVDVSGGGVRFEFRGKSGKMHRTGIRDRRLARIVHSCEELRGQKLFQYIEQEGATHAVESQHVNAYIQEATGEHFTAKDFRTWAATLLAAQTLAQGERPTSQAHAKHVLAACVKAVSQRLGNTPAVCRSSYIHPGVLSAYAEDRLAEAFGGCAGSAEALEQTLLEFLDHLQTAAPGAPRGHPGKRD